MQPPNILFAHYQHSIILGCLTLLAGMGMASLLPFLPVDFWLTWFAAALILGMVIAWFQPQKSLLFSISLLTCMLAGGTWFQHQHFDPHHTSVMHQGTVANASITGQVIANGPHRKQWILETQTLNQQACTGRILLKLKTLVAPFKLGDMVTIDGTLQQPHHALFAGDFDYASYLHQFKLVGIIQAKRITPSPTPLHLQKPQHWPFILLQSASNYRDKLTHVFQRALPGPNGNLLASIVLGDHAVAMDPDLKTDFRRAGLAHILAASGFNVGIVGVFILAMGRWLRLPRTLMFILAMLGVLFYMLLTGLPPSVQRAGMMMELGLVLKLLNRHMTPLCLLCISAVALCLLNPMLVTMLGFQLSFLSTFGLLSMVSPLQQFTGFYSTYTLASIMWVPIVAQWWVTPLLWHHFNQIQLFSVFANIIAIPIVALLTAAGFMLGGVALFWPSLAQLMLPLTSGLCSVLTNIAAFFSKSTLAVWTVASPSWPVVITLVLSLLLLGLGLQLNWKPNLKPLLTWSLIILLCVGLVPFSVAKWQQQHQLKVTWLPLDYFTERGITLIQLPHQQTIGLTTQMSYPMARQLEKYLDHHGIQQLQILYALNPNPDDATWRGLSLLNQHHRLSQLVISPSVVEPHAPLWQQLAQQDTPVFTTQDSLLVKSAALKNWQQTAMSINGQEALVRIDPPKGCIAWQVLPIDSAVGELAPALQGCQAVIRVKNHVGVLWQQHHAIPLSGYRTFTLPLP